jgi:hypothetical protein
MAKFYVRMYGESDYLTSHNDFAFQALSSIKKWSSNQVVIEYDTDVTVPARILRAAEIRKDHKKLKKELTEDLQTAKDTLASYRDPNSGHFTGWTAERIQPVSKIGSRTCKEKYARDK